MQLTLYTDYSLRVLLYLAARDDELSTISEIADSYGISRNHLVKVVHNLAGLGYIKTTRGKGGGMRLSRPTEQINIGDVVRKTEGSFELVECLSKNPSHCPIAPACTLKGAISEALNAFISVLDRYSLADVARNKRQLAPLLRIDTPVALKLHARDHRNRLT